MNLYQQIIFTTLALVFGLLHLILFKYNRHLKSNLYFAVFSIIYAANVFFDFQASFAIERNLELFYLRIHRPLMAFNPVFLLLFLYALFKTRIPKQFWFITMGIIITSILGIIDPIKYFFYINIFLLALIIEAIREIRSAVNNRKENAKLIAVGFGFFSIFPLYDGLMDFGLFEPFYGIYNGSHFGFLGLIITTSFYLARDFAKTNERMLNNERQAKELELKQRILEIEDARKSKELEEARQLQLSMLPKSIDEIPGLDICFHMQTATEVGGDYYDYHLADAGTLTIAIGDATGHGMKAGILVTVIKSLFIANSSPINILAFFQKCSKIIKKMQLGNLYMAMMLVKIKEQKMTFSSAGMPPVLLYRKKTNSIEELLIKGMPLGGPSFSYKQDDVVLEQGDVVLIMSDGFPELFNDKGAMLDYPRIKKLLHEAAESSADGIVKHLISAGDKWRNGKEQDDDITFVVLKVKHNTDLL